MPRVAQPLLMIETMHRAITSTTESTIAGIGADASANAAKGRNSEHGGHATAGGAYTLASGQRLNRNANDETAAILSDRRREGFGI